MKAMTRCRGIRAKGITARQIRTDSSTTVEAIHSSRFVAGSEASSESARLTWSKGVVSIARGGLGYD